MTLATEVTLLKDKTNELLDKVLATHDLAQVQVAAAAEAVGAKEIAVTKAEEAGDSAEASESSRLASGVSASAADAAKAAAEVARDAALLSSGNWPTTAAALGNGVAGHASLAAGTGGANGTFALAFTGGTQVLAPIGYFVVAGGAVVQVVITYPGYYSAGTPTLGFAASAGLTGASATAVMAPNVAAGRYFSVPVVGSTDSLILYLNSAGVAVEQNRYLSAAGVPITLQSPAGFALVFKDGQGKYAGGLQDDGTLRFAAADFDALAADAAVLGDVSATSLQVAGATLEALPGNKYVWGIRDGSGRLALAVKADGSVVMGKPALPALPADYSMASAAEINHIISYGQSLSIGADNFAMSKVAYGNSLKFSGGVRPSDAGSTNDLKYASLVPLIETDTPYGETPVFGACQMIRDLMAFENGIPIDFSGYALLGSAPGVGGLDIASLSPGTSVYNRMIDDVDYGYLRSQEITRSYRCASMFWTQGEGDYSAATSKAAYKSAFEALLTNFRADVLTASGQPDAPPIIMGQTSSHLRYVYNGIPSAASCQIALAQLELSIEQAHAYLACPMYQFDFVAGGFDNPHLTNWSSKWYGAYLGLALARVEAGLDWQPLRPLSLTRQGVICLIKFHVPVKPLVIDTVNVAANSGHGFKLFAADGTTEIPLVSVSVAGVDTVKLVAATAIPAGAIVRYAFHTDTPTGHSGRLNGARGNLRDSQGDYIRFDPHGIDRPMHNWCVISQPTFA